MGSLQSKALSSKDWSLISHLRNPPALSFHLHSWKETKKGIFSSSAKTGDQSSRDGEEEKGPRSQGLGFKPTCY